MADVSSQALPMLSMIPAEGADQVAVDWQADFPELIIAIDEMDIILRVSRNLRETT